MKCENDKNKKYFPAIAKQETKNGGLFVRSKRDFTLAQKFLNIIKRKAFGRGWGVVYPGIRYSSIFMSSDPPGESRMFSVVCGKLCAAHFIRFAPRTSSSPRFSLHIWSRMSLKHLQQSHFLFIPVPGLSC